MPYEKKFPYYSVMITTHDGRQFNFRNVTPEEVGKFRQDLFLIGFRFEHTIRSWEIIAPANIKTVMILGEETKF